MAQLLIVRAVGFGDSELLNFDSWEEACEYAEDLFANLTYAEQLNTNALVTE